MGYDSLRIELRYRHIWQTKWSEADRRTNTYEGSPGISPGGGGVGGVGGRGGGSRGRRARSLNRNVHYENSRGQQGGQAMGNGFDDEGNRVENKTIINIR
jgi:hypothetical protein